MPVVLFTLGGGGGGGSAHGRHVTGGAAGAEGGCTRGAMACAGDDGPCGTGQWGPGWAEVHREGDGRACRRDPGRGGRSGSMGSRVS